MSKTIIIAEAGVNHNGNLTIAKELIDASSEAGADYVKFQSFIAEENISRHAEKANYQKNNTIDKHESQLEMVRKLELSSKDHKSLVDYCKERDIKFLSTAFDFSSIDLLTGFNLDFFKIPSGEITNLPYLERAAQLHIPIILSTGMSTLTEVQNAFQILLKNGAKRENIIALHCNTEYPTPMEDVNLKAMLTLKRELGVEVGYSDHTLGIEVSIAAVALGAKVIEKHFTLDRSMEGPDHRASLEPFELKMMVSAIRNIESALGSGIKIPSKSELQNLPIARKSIHAKVPIAKGEIFTKTNLICKRPGNGISPMKWYDVLGKTATKNYVADELIRM